MALVTYQANAGFIGGVINNGHNGSFDVEAALIAGSGAFTVDDQVNPLLISALDKYTGVHRSGVQPVTPVVVDVAGPLYAHGGNPLFGDTLIRGADGIFAPSQFGPRSGAAAGRLLHIKGVGVVNAEELYGHSYVSGSGLTVGQRYSDLLSSYYNLTQSNKGVAGTTASNDLAANFTGGLARVIGQAVPQFAIFNYGINDIGNFGPVANSAPGAQAALIAGVSRARTIPGQVRTNAPGGGLAYDGSWVDSTVGYHYSVANGSVITLTTPVGFPGGVIAFRLFAQKTTGAVYTLGGAAAGSIDTRSIPSTYAGAPTIANPVVLRTGVLPPGSGQVITITTSSTVTNSFFGGWQVEAVNPPLVLILNQPRAPIYSNNYSIGVSSCIYIPTDADVTALNTSMSAIPALFDSLVNVVDLDTPFAKNVAYFQGGIDIHPSVAGSVVIAQTIESAIFANANVTVV